MLIAAHLAPAPGRSRSPPKAKNGNASDLRCAGKVPSIEFDSADETASLRCKLMSRALRVHRAAGG